MKRKLYCCDPSKRLHEDYYRNQSGGAGTIPVFTERRYQRGHGLAQTIGGLFKRFVVPLVARHAKRIGKQILGNVAKTGMEVVGDVMEGRSAKETIKERGLSGIKRTVGDIVRQSPLNFGSSSSSSSTASPPPKIKKQQLQPQRRQQQQQKRRKKTKTKVIAKSGRGRDIFA